MRVIQLSYILFFLFFINIGMADSKLHFSWQKSVAGNLELYLSCEHSIASICMDLLADKFECREFAQKTFCRVESEACLSCAGDSNELTKFAVAAEQQYQLLEPVDHSVFLSTLSNQNWFLFDAFSPFNFLTPVKGTELLNRFRFFCGEEADNALALFAIDGQKRSLQPTQWIVCKQGEQSELLSIGSRL